MKKKKIILSAGGTGGHLFPAQSLAAELTEYDILFVAGGLACNPYFDQNQFAYEEIACATFSFKKPFQMFQRSLQILKGMQQSKRIIHHFSPDLVVGFGSFFTLPVLAGALLEKIPIVLHEQNTIPGKVNRLFSSVAHTTAITFPKTRDFLKKGSRSKAVEVIFPLRKQQEKHYKEAWDYFGVDPEKEILLVFGGSKGAVGINRLFLDTVSKLADVQVLHFTGSDERTKEAKEKYEKLGIKAYVKSFEPCMHLAMQIADLAITRAGASTVAELIEYELPAILIPYPFATDNHQEENGAYFVSHVKGGKMYKECRLNADFLSRCIAEQLSEANRLKANIADYKSKRKNLQLADLIRGLEPVFTFEMC